MFYEHEREEHRRELARMPVKPFCRSLPHPSEKLWPLFDKYIAGRGLSVPLARANKWYPTHHVDSFARCVIPGTSNQPGNLYWQARDMIGTAPRRYESPHGVRRGDSVVVMWPEDIGGAAIVEGPMDALAAAEVGFVGIALMGVTPSDEVLDNVARLVAPMDYVPLVMDRDQEAAMAEVLRRLLDRNVTPSLRSPYPHKDLAEVARADRRAVLL